MKINSKQSYERPEALAVEITRDTDICQASIQDLTQIDGEDWEY